MKTILRIILILLVASLVAEVFSLAVNNDSTTAGSNNGQSAIQPTDQPEGSDHDSGSLAGGFAGVLGTLAKLSGITILVLVIQKGFRQLGNRRTISTGQ